MATRRAAPAEMPGTGFTKSAAAALYIYDGTGTPVPGEAYAIAFLPPAGATDLPATLTLADSWDRPGVYLFLDHLPTDQARFVAAVHGYLTAGGLAAARFVWIGAAAAPPGVWSVQALAVAGTGADATLARFGALTFENYVLCLDQGLAVSAADADGPAAAFVITQVAFGAGRVRLETGSGMAPLTEIGATVQIPMTGPTIGCLAFELAIVGDDPVAQMRALGAGIPFYYPDSTWDGAYLAALTYPLLDPASAAVRFQVTLDPVNPLLPARSLFGLLPATGTAAPLASYYRTWVGRTVGLTPLAGASPGFALAPRPRYADDPAPSLTLVPNGGFTIAIQPIVGAADPPGESVGTTRIMCGLSPVEYVGYLPVVGTVANVATFYPGQPGYAAWFEPGAESSATGPLGAAATTSYVGFTANGPAALNYYSQPDQSVFYDPSSASSADSNFLDFRELVVGALASGAAAALPMVPLAGIGGDPAAQALHAQYEVKVVSQARRAAIHAGGIAANDDAGATSSPVASSATTRHGMLGFFGTPPASAVPMVKVQLAQSGAGAQTLVLAGSGGGDIAGPLKQALLGSQLFLVMSDPAAFARNASLPAALLEIAGVPFDLDPANWAANGTILVYKYAGASIASLARDLGSWSSPDDFTDGAQTQDALLAIIADIDQRALTDPDFAHVHHAVTEPAWNGILAFNAQVSLAAMPSQLAGVAAGIDPAHFNAHHLGINLSPITVTNGALAMRDTALFGLIDYRDESAFADTGPGDGFKVSMLKILFGNSEIRSFACTIELLVTELFGSPVRLADGNGQNVVSLNGYYQRTAAGEAFSFSSARDLHFKALSEVVDEIEITGADFVTLNPDVAAGTDGARPLRTQFVFAGKLRFRDVPGFDALSFGDIAGPAPQAGGLSFQKLVIHMDYDLLPDGRTRNRRFAFDAQDLAIDLAASIARPQSLVAHFPLKYKGFLAAQSGSTPAGLGYLAAATPVTETPLRYPWYALQYELNLGSFGALASSAGFTATVLIGWSGGPGTSVYVGVKIPGASPENLSFSIEGLLGLSIDDVRFTADPAPQGGTAYTLVFTNLALRFFGIKIPHSAYVDLILFGNPDPSKQAASLGWYAAYSAA